MKLIWVVSIAAAGMAQSAEAVDIGKALDRPVTQTFTSTKNIYDLERCIILADGPGVPVVYRQPDRPDEETIAYTGNGSTVINVVTLKRAGGTTTIETHEAHGITAGVLRKTPEGVAACV